MHELVAASRVSMLKRHSVFLFALFLFGAVAAEARVLSYAPVSDRNAVPAVQHRMNRHFLLVEDMTGQPTFWWGPMDLVAQLVLHDSTGQEEPKVVYPTNGGHARIAGSAVRQDEGSAPRLFASVVSGTTAATTYKHLLSRDGGASWIELPLPGNGRLLQEAVPDLGGPHARVRGSQIRIGTSAVPFVVALQVGAETQVWSVRESGAVTHLAKFAGIARLVGSDRSGERVVIALPPAEGGLIPLRVVHVESGASEQPGAVATHLHRLETWLTPSGALYISGLSTGSDAKLWKLESGTIVEIASAPASQASPFLIAVPTADYSGAWILERPPGSPAVLSLHEGSTKTEQWTDITSPEIEAIHASASGTKLLIQVHRPRPQTDRIFIDPALAVWTVGDPAPRQYDELFLNEGPIKGFVHLDVDAMESGAPFIFDSASMTTFVPGGCCLSAGGGGGDVIQEWGVVRASLAQKLILPGVARLPGAYGTSWRTDVLFRNGDDEPLPLTVRYVPQINIGGQSLEGVLTLQPNQVRLMRDALHTMFGVEVGGGVLHLEPPVGRSVQVVSRTYTDSEAGTYGMGLLAIDSNAAAGPRFPLYFSGGIQGEHFRTNFLITDASGRGTGAHIRFHGSEPEKSWHTFEVAAPAGGQRQFNGIGPMFSISGFASGSLVVEPERGTSIATVVVIDNRTNDPTYFPPDLPTSVTRIIPVIGHLDGANDSRYRSDLYLFNPDDRPQTILLRAKAWDSAPGSQESALNLTLLPKESKVIRDVLHTAFGMTGLARLRFSSAPTGESIRVTSRSYTIDDSGATYGLLIPPLNSFQAAAPAETLEILTMGGEGFRTNLALVDLQAWSQSSVHRVQIEIIDAAGKRIDRFEVSVPATGGMQLNDLFRARGLGSPDAAIIRLTPVTGLIGAYATVVDNGTNDPTYMPAVLAATD